MTDPGSTATLDAIRVVVALLSVAALTALVTRRLRIPYTVSLVVLGIVAGVLLPTGTIRVTPELVLLVLVPGLVFEAALRLELDDLRSTFGWMVLLAAPGVLVSAAIVALVLNLATGLPLQLGMVVGSMVAATDPVAIIATFRNLGAPRRLATLVEGESLFNDGTALVLFVVAVASVTGTVSLAEMGESVLVTVVTSIGVGLAAGWLATRLMRLVDDHVIELTLSLAAAYGTYVLVDALRQSGIIATVAAGVVIGTYGRQVGLSKHALEALDVVWELVAFVLTAFAFLLVGLAISFGDLLAAAPSIVWGVVAILVGRAIVVYGLLGTAARLLRDRTQLTTVPMGWLHVMFWAGLRGAVAVAMALSLPESFPQRALLQEITYGVVLFTLFVQGTTAERVVGRVGLAVTT
ncbi:MAG TPA: cation:proton antiporter [Candidatus Dormibacteraeota bacterium]|nr:cation:proton antiporter [Candidatus Dormibacteraeota bacterium]